MSESGSLVENDRESVKQIVQTPTKEDAGKEQDVILDESEHSCVIKIAASSLNCSQEGPQGRRVRKLTEKGQELQEEQIKRLERRFNSNYEKWKVLVKDAKQSSKTCNSKAMLQEHAAKIRKASTELEQIYEDIRRVQTPHQDMRRRIDTCEEVTKEIVEAANGCLASNEQEDFKSARSLKLRPDTQSIISSRSRSVHRSHVGSVISSRSSSLSSLKRQDAAAEAAANEATLEVFHEQEQHFKELQRLEAEDKRLQAEREVENEKRRQMLEAKRREIERLETVKKLKAAKARQEVYAQSICSDEEISELLHGCGSVRAKKEATTQNATTQHHSDTPQAVTHSTNCNVK
uniref:uncharacterized protein LOC124066303 n=1 Tax=Scatophagus argus TaxID=75038 RepID=UPI001ED7DF69|nr:uncharacterized protein LOC124066303 [Scatophagus argus]